MGDVYIYGFSAGESAVDAFAGAVARVTDGELYSLSIAHLGIGTRDLLAGRAPWPLLGGKLGPNGALSWDKASVAEAIDRLRRHDEPGLEAGVSFRLRFPADPVSAASLYVRGAEHQRRFGDAPLKIVLHGADAFPEEGSDAERDRLILDFLGAGAGHDRLAILTDEAWDESSFNAYTVASTAPGRTFATDFARGWLSDHTEVRMAPFALASPAEVRRAIEGASETRAPEAIRNHSDGSLSKGDVLRILDAPESDVLEAACGKTYGSPNGRSPISPGGGIEGTFTPRVRPIAGGGLLIGAGAFQPLWRLYDEAASILLA